MVHHSQFERIEELKEQGKLDKALEVANQMLVRDPKNKEALFQVADIEYRKGEIMRAEKPIDFLLEGAGSDAMGLYVKGVLEMEKTNRNQAKAYFKRSLQMINEENPEILRCYGLCEYRSGNREDGINHLRRAHEINTKDAEILLNMIEIAILEEQRKTAQKYIQIYKKGKKEMQFFDRSAEYYDEKVALFEEYLKNHLSSS